MLLLKRKNSHLFFSNFFRTTKEKVNYEGDESVEISDVDSVEKRMNVSQLINRFEYIQHSQENRSNSDFWKYREHKAAAVKASVNRARHHSYSSGRCLLDQFAGYLRAPHIIFIKNRSGCMLIPNKLFLACFAFAR